MPAWENAPIVANKNAWENAPVIDDENAAITPPERSGVSRFLSGVGGAILNNAAAVSDLLPDNKATEWLQEAGKEGIENAPGIAGKAGQVAGDIAPYFATGGGGLTLQSLKAAMLAAATTPGSADDRIKSGAEMALGNVLLGKAMQGAGRVAGNKLAASERNAAIKNANTLMKRDAQTAGRLEGFVNSPSESNPSITNQILESIAGKAATRQEAQIRNAGKTTALTRRALGLPDDAILNSEKFKEVIKANYKPYEDVAKLRTPPSLISGSGITTTARQDLDALKVAQANARQLYRANQANPHPDTLALFNAEKAKIAALEKRFDIRANQAGKPELIEELKQARVNIAKAYTAKDATNKSTGMVDARDFGKRIDKEKPLTGEMRIAGDFEQSFPNAIRDPEHVPAPSVNQMLHMIAPVLGGAGGFAAGGAPGAIAGAVGAELAPRAARSLILSEPYQNLFAKIPVAERSSVLKIMDALMNSGTSQRLRPALINQLSRQLNDNNNR